MSETASRGIRVITAPKYLAAESNPRKSRYVFAYEITIENHGRAPAKLISRHWIITDGHGEIRHVRGAGVVGQQPRLEPGGSFVYTSFCPLTTPVGTMEGSYQMRTDEGEEFDAAIPAFTLAVPHSLN